MYSPWRIPVLDRRHLVPGGHVSVLAILERLEFKRFTFPPIMVTGNTFQCSVTLQLWNSFRLPCYQLQIIFIATIQQLIQQQFKSWFLNCFLWVQGLILSDLFRPVLKFVIIFFCCVLILQLLFYFCVFLSVQQKQ